MPSIVFLFIYLVTEVVDLSLEIVQLFFCLSLSFVC